MNTKALYFIALIPHDELRHQVKGLKDEIRENFGASHALKSPAHITLQMPFRRNETEEEKIIDALRSFAEMRKSFQISLSGFDCFSPRVIFIKVANHEPIKSLHADLRLVLKEIAFSQKELRAGIHPHMTIATRDLAEDAYNKAWPQYSQREFQAEFTARSLFLLKHNGKHWEVFKEFFFN